MQGGAALTVSSQEAIPGSSASTMLAPGDIAEIPPFRKRLPTPEARAPRGPTPPARAPAPAPAPLPRAEFALRATPADLGGKHGRHATFEWPCGDAYDGWAANGKRQGRGTYTFANGATLECDWVEDAPGGRGVFKVPRGAVYRGPFRDGLFHGKGVLKFGGNTYRGAFRAGAFHGSGTLALAGGDRYEGAFRNHRFHGRGAYFWKSGQRYEGLFEEGAMTGRGVASWPGGQRYAGDYVDGRREGRGDLRGGAGQRYRGEFADGYPHGAGRFASSNGKSVEGTFAMGAFVPPGPAPAPDEPGCPPNADPEET